MRWRAWRKREQLPDGSLATSTGYEDSFSRAGARENDLLADLSKRVTQLEREVAALEEDVDGCLKDLDELDTLEHS